ncbi:MAG: malto-oligosyltrehalose trehalohydrolase [Verrucomicrobia bacterium]|nr:malto-oligosyltrehalose trehalohydrolase [Verrucomicrobiota bacterium]
MMKNRVFSQGAELTGTGVSFRTWVTGKKNVSVVIFGENDNVVRELQLRAEPTGYYSVTDAASSAGTLYKYRLDDNVFPDVASRYQPKGVHGPSQVVDGRSFRWTDLEWKAPALRELVIYELNVGTFTPEGTFEAIIPRLDHFKKLGVNAIELMPIADFAGNRNWGYDCVSIYAPSRAYGEPDGLRTLVNAAHAAGIAVILDVVYNHLGPDGNYMGAYSDDYFNAAHDTPWGAAFNLDKPGSEPVRNHFAENPLYWVSEFHVDGFRLDATQAIPDDSPKHLVQEIAERVQAAGAFVICEDPRNERKLVLPRDQGGYGCNAVWSDDFHHVTRVQMTKEQEGYMGYFKGTMEELVKTMREGWLFTGELQKDGIPRGTPGADIEPEHFVHCISNHDQVGNRAYGDRLNKVVPAAAYRAASALLLTGPYTPMLFMGQEWAASTPFLYFTDHYDELGRGVTEGRRKEFADFSDFRDPKKRTLIPDPQALTTFTNSKLIWTELEQSPHAETLRLYSDFLRFRRTKIKERGRGCWLVAQVSHRAIALRYRRPKQGDILILAQLLANETILEPTNELLRPAQGRTWRFEISSNESIYGGERTGLFDPEKNQFVLTEPELIVFCEHDQKDA